MKENYEYDEKETASSAPRNLMLSQIKMHINNSSFSSGSNEKIENVLILQGGGSLGAFGCGVFKALSQKAM